MRRSCFPFHSAPEEHKSFFFFSISFFPPWISFLSLLLRSRSESRCSCVRDERMMLVSLLLVSHRRSFILVFVCSATVWCLFLWWELFLSWHHRTVIALISWNLIPVVGVCWNLQSNRSLNLLAHMCKRGVYYRNTSASHCDRLLRTNVKFIVTFSSVQWYFTLNKFISHSCVKIMQSSIPRISRKWMKKRIKSALSTLKFNLTFPFLTLRWETKKNLRLSVRFLNSLRRKNEWIEPSRTACLCTHIFLANISNCSWIADWAVEIFPLTYYWRTNLPEAFSFRYIVKKTLQKCM